MVVEDAETGIACFRCIHQEELGIVEDLGEFKAIAGPGLNVILWPLVQIAGILSLRLQQLDIIVETKTKENAIVKIHLAVQYRIIREKVYDAYYRLSDPKEQIESYVYDVVRAQVPTIALNLLFSSKGTIADAVKLHLQDVMEEYGYSIVNVLITDIIPDDKIKATMNELNVAERLKAAAVFKAETEKVKQVRKAEAFAESLYQDGLGTARQRKAIGEGLQLNVAELEATLPNTTTQEAINIIQISQYMDTIESVGAKSLILEHKPGNITNIQKRFEEDLTNVDNTSNPNSPLP